MTKEWKALGSYGTIGLELVLSIIFGYLGGRWLDGRFGTAPWLTAIGSAFGVAAGVRAIYRSWKEMQAIARQEELEEGNPAPMFPKDEHLADDRKIRELAGDEEPEEGHDRDSDEAAPAPRSNGRRDAAN